jgi:hypothetical protein
LHGVPNTIISDRGAQFIACFWEQLQSTLGTKLIRSLYYSLWYKLGQVSRLGRVFLLQ